MIVYLMGRKEVGGDGFVLEQASANTSVADAWKSKGGHVVAYNTAPTRYNVVAYQDKEGNSIEM